MELTTCVLLLAFAATAIDSICDNCPKPQPTGTPIPTPACIGYDICKTFTGFRAGSFRSPYNPSAFITCFASDNVDGFDFRCGMCHPPLYFSEKCQSCEYNKLDSMNVCTTTQKPNLAPTTDYFKDFCKYVQKDGNYADVDNESYFYSCVASNTYHMYCGDTRLFYNATCDACMWKKLTNLR